MTQVQESNKLPTWDKTKGKLSNHYKFESIKTFIDHIKKSEKKLKDTSPSFDGYLPCHCQQFVMFLALQMGLYPRSIKEIPKPIHKWAKRVFLLALNNKVWDACSLGTISSRFALDIMDYSHQKRYATCIASAIKGDISNIEFRKLINLKKREK